MSEQTAQRTVHRWRGDRVARAGTSLAVEEPLEIRLGGRRFTLTMRTPGSDEELVTGFLFSEGFIDSAREIDEIRPVIGRRGTPEPHVLDVMLNVPADQLRGRLRRNFLISSSCGLCGKTSIEAIRRRVDPPRGSASMEAATIRGLGPRMLAAQSVFAETGGLHAAALFGLRGDLRLLREDIGRHNAVDKVIGRALKDEGLPLDDSVMVVSGRLSFEIVQKAAAAGLPILAAVSAPSSLAVELAEQVGTTLIGFLRDSTFNVYCRPDRVTG